MAYYGGFPVNYQPMVPQQFQAPAYQQPQPAQAQAQQNGLIWVQGENAAKSYLVAPGCTVDLWDSEEKVIYLKSADASGMPSMKILDYTVRGEATAPAVEYATKGDLDALAEKVKELSRRKAKIVREVEDDE